MGMAGMQQAAQDPAMLAQLMKDMQDPEMIAEAKKMMESKEFKKQMKKLEKDPNFKKAMDQAGQAFEDPRTAGMMTAKAEQMMREGGAQVSVVFWRRYRLSTTPQFAYQLVSNSRSSTLIVVARQDAAGHAERHADDATGPEGHEGDAGPDEGPRGS